jgi:hypothetical protein
VLIFFCSCNEPNPRYETTTLKNFSDADREEKKRIHTHYYHQSSGVVDDGRSWRSLSFISNAAFLNSRQRDVDRSQ